MNSTNQFDELYPDVAKDGGLINALQRALRSIARRSK
jgi:hypothetical protein